MIHCSLEERTRGKPPFWCTFIYAFNSALERCALWEDLIALHVHIRGPWVMMGDFNCIMKPEERIGVAVRPQEIVDIQDCMLRCGMTDLNSTRCLFTWNNKQKEDTRVFCKLDRVMVNEAWEEAFPSANAHFMPEIYFDHCPMVVQVYPQLQTGRYPFKYYTIWSSASNFQEIVRACWDTRIEGSLMFRVVSKLKLVKKALKKLNAEGFNDMHAA